MERKRTISQVILETLSEVGGLTLDAVFPSNRVEGRVWRSILGLPGGYEFSKPTFSVTLSRLKKQGLVVRIKNKHGAIWLPTPKGQAKVKSYDIKPAKPDGVPRLVVYDIPEVQRKKRDLLRCELTVCDYKQLQKSVWLGYSPLPEEFVRSLKDMNLQGRVHIVSIRKKGTLTEF